MFPLNILLISGDTEIEGAVREAARRSGVALTVAHTAYEAVREFTHGFERLSLILLDLDSDIHGVTLFNALEDCRGKAPVVVLTGSEESYMKPLAMAHGAADCVGKPISSACFERFFAFHCALSSN